MNKKAARLAEVAAAAIAPGSANPPVAAMGSPSIVATSGKQDLAAQVDLAANKTSPYNGSRPENESSSREEEPATKKIRKTTTVIVETNAIPSEFLEKDLTLKKIRKFKDFLTRSSLSGRSYSTDERQSLIKKEAKREIFYKFIIHAESCNLADPAEWELLSDAELFPLLVKIFKHGHSEASVRDQLLELVIHFSLQTGYSSLFGFLRIIDNLLEEYESTPLLKKQEEDYVKLVLDNFPTDPLHIRLKQLTEDLGTPKTFTEFRSKLLKSANRLHNSYNDMIACELISESED